MSFALLNGRVKKQGFAARSLNCRYRQGSSCRIKFASPIRRSDREFQRGGVASHCIASECLPSGLSAKFPDLAFPGRHEAVDSVPLLRLVSGLPTRDKTAVAFPVKQEAICNSSTRVTLSLGPCASAARGVLPLG